MIMECSIFQDALEIVSSSTELVRNNAENNLDSGTPLVYYMFAWESACMPCTHLPIWAGYFAWTLVVNIVAGYHVVLQ